MQTRLWSRTCCTGVLLLTGLAVGLSARSAWGADYVIVVGITRSMKDPISRTDNRLRIATVQSALTKYLKELPSCTRIHLIAFNTGIVSEQELVLKTDAAWQAALAWVADLSKISTGDNYLWSTCRVALRTATQFANQTPGQPVSVFVLTDGQDTEPGGPSLEQILKEFPLKTRENEILTSFIFLGNLDIRSAGKARDLGIEVMVNRDWTNIFPPVIKWTPVPAKVGQELSLFGTAQSTYDSYEWNIDGRTRFGNLKTVTHTFAKAGDHHVELTVVDSSGRATAVTAMVDVHKTDLTSDCVISASEVAPGQAVKLFSRVTGQPVGYSWKINGKEVGTAADHVHTFDKEGDYEVMLEIRDDSTKAISRKKFIQVREPNVLMTFKGPTTVTAGQTAQFISYSLGRLVAYTWKFGDGTTSNERHPVHIYENKGTTPKDYRVTLQGKTVTGKIFKSSPAVVQVLPPPPVEPPPRAAFRVVGAAPYKVGLRMQMMNTSNGRIDSYLWSLGGESTSTEKAAEFTPTSIGEKILRLVVTGPGGSSTNEQKVMIVPRYSALGITRILHSPQKPRMDRGEPVTVTFQAAITGDYDTVWWDFGDGFRSGRLQPTHTYTVASNYTVRVTARNAGHLESSAVIQIQVLPPPPWWHKIPLFVGIALTVWVLIIVPFCLKPALLPHETAALRSSVTYKLHLLARKGYFTWLWPRHSVTIGTQQSDDIHLAVSDGSQRTLAVIKRCFASETYQLLPQEVNGVKLLEKYLVAIPPGEGRVLQDGDQVCIGEETFSWTFSSMRKKALTLPAGSSSDLVNPPLSPSSPQT